jgi:hypothetical protein
LIVVAVTTDNVPHIVAELARRDVGNAILLLDTPVLPLRGLSATRHFSRFARVLVSEDNIALPPLLLARKLIERGELGRLRRIFFFHNGYKFHALAGLKLLAGERIHRIVNRKFPGVRQKTIEFASGIVATMYEPRDYAVGKFLIECERGTIADYDHAAAPRHRIGYVLDGPIYRGLTLDGAEVEPSSLDQLYRRHIGTDVFGATPMNTMKVRGLMDVIVGSLDTRSRFRYAPSEGLVDAIAAKLADRVGYVALPRVLERLAAVVDRR